MIESYNVVCIRCGNIWEVSQKTNPELFAEAQERSKTYLDALPINGADDGCSYCQYKQEGQDEIIAQLKAEEAFFDTKLRGEST